jgi:hypothetical protein
MFRKTAFIALLGAGILGTTAHAQTVDQRHAYQQQRIDRGVASGRLTPGEAAHVERQQASIDRQEDRMRDRNGGDLTGRDRAVLQHRENRASRHIYRAKHNGRRY